MYRNDDKEKEAKIEERKKRIHRKRKLTGILALLGCFTALFLMMFLGTAVYVWIEDGLEKTSNIVAEELGSEALEEGKVEETKTYTKEEVDLAIEEAKIEARAVENKKILQELADNLSSGLTVIQSLRPLYKNHLVVASGGKFNFVPINDSLKKNSLIQENLNVLENGLYEYMENEKVVSIKGIDVSKHQGKIDWEKVAADGVEYAFIRVGLRGYSTGAVVEDEYYEENIVGAKANGIKVGVYFFSQAITEEEAIEEANFVLERIAKYKLDYPVVFDVERVVSESARMNSLSVEERTNITIAFCNHIKEAGYEAMIYHNMEMGIMFIDLERLEEYPKWFAYYNTDLYYPYAYDIWQYSETGVVDGIVGNVDLNIAFRSW